MAAFNWRRASEGAVISALLSGFTVLQVSIANPQAALRATLISAAITATITFLKGIGQSVQDASVITTQVTQPANTTALTETTVTTPGGDHV